jgi:hypothetical protein
LSFTALAIKLYSIKSTKKYDVTYGCSNKMEGQGIIFFFSNIIQQVKEIQKGHRVDGEINF